MATSRSLVTIPATSLPVLHPMAQSPRRASDASAAAKYME
eukprot:CAMPEP_0175866208 /NCGR_PEP_ID=MMETSP0107_2-20121207/34089_1 /TAXON_ID=195067 ORGANISM="Goniomonas pacifica, Strain CCMP1869" /NCGR_SAMPLE_ID=MMETSP0107_2 /ASSEMBLY_ACC=CAM_ASM_000203 /LENGTH=39 /DNA_ID= /DNA_START= /DNA_END= /DNA_ORIENTATION=